MAIKLTYYTLVIPISTVLSKFPAGWEAWIEKNKTDGCGACWYDDHLFARASMDPRAVEKIQDSWEKCGFKGKTEVDGESRWEEFCLAEAGRCDWLSYCENSPAVYLSGRTPGPVFDPLPRCFEK